MDCLQFYVPDLEAGLSFYRDRLGHARFWRTDTAAGLRLLESEAELVLQTQAPRQETDFLVDSADEAAELIEKAGGKVIVSPFDIQIDRCVILEDPWGTVTPTFTQVYLLSRAHIAGRLHIENLSD